MQDLIFFGIDISEIIDHALQHWLLPVDQTHRMFILYLLTAFLLAWFVWLREQHRHHVKTSPRDFLKWLFDPKIYGHESARQDYLFFFLNGIVFYGILSQFSSTLRPMVVVVMNVMTQYFGELSAPVITGVTSKVLYTFVYILLFDFGLFLAHWLFHKVPWMWPFHKVHHSAEVLTPVTVLRMHPVDIFFTSMLVLVFISIGTGVFVYLSKGAEVAGIDILGLNIFIFLFYIFGYNLRHSHVWLSYPPAVSNIFVSPAQHQIHHSIEPKHFDKNMGFIFAFWDKLFGTLYVPLTHEKISYGISKKEPNPHKSVLALFVDPFAECFHYFSSRYAKKGLDGLGKGITGLGGGVIIFLLFYIAVVVPADRQLALPLSVHLEELTWTEVKYAMEKNSYDTVIVPVGGTEQNGPHVVLGKHNYIIRYTTGEIAKEIGRTFVAPVIAYVPEGKILPAPTEHMRWPGTITVPDKVLEETLYWAAASMKAHGFKKIFFIGDSYHNQEPQERTAARLSKDWAGEGILVASISDYYKKNSQISWLQTQGYTEAEIGGHAGIRDTSEVKAVYPRGVRSGRKIVKGNPVGFSGDPRKASRRIGKRMLALKIQAAVKQIKNVTNTHK